jgi:nucleoside-triphosphatase THEP1
MGTEITTSQAFQEKMFARIREQMGDLLTDDDLKKLVEAAMQKAFFEERVIVVDHYGRTEKRAPHFIELITAEMKKKVGESVSAWVAEHPEEITKAINDILAKGVVAMVIHYLEQKMEWPMRELAERLRSKGVL